MGDILRAMQITKDRKHAAELLNRLDAGQLAAVVHLLEVMTDPVARAVVTAPLDDEAVTEEDRRRFREGREWFTQQGGKGIAMEEVLADFGWKPEDLSSR